MLCSRNLKVFQSNYRIRITKWAPIGLVRMKSSAEPKTKTYSHTIIFPKTDFPARSNSARKDEIQEIAKFSELYNWQRENLKGPEFVLHDGPPYANGDLHMGHAVNKIIKDINNRHQILLGNRVHYVPGWDCHGLPIELKALQQTKHTMGPSNPVEIRKTARSFALKTIERQKEQFKSWGIMADWDGQCYRTLDNGYVKKQLELFYEMYEKGLIFRALKPVYWSPSSRTALAEAELEYDPQFKSTEVYVSFPLDTIPEAIKEAAQGETLSAIIWTTTPWTLVANRAICYHPQLKYSVVRMAGLSGRYLVASALVEELEKVLERGVEKMAEFEGHQLAGGRYYHKILAQSFPLLGAGHVSAAKGTGLVHTAPAHGPDDFLVGLEHDIPVECNVDESGLYTNLGPLDGLYVLKEGQEAVITLLGREVLKRGVHTHSYPLDWRTKKPVILRASHQWFINTEALKEKALEALEEVQILPASTAVQSRAGFRARVASRPHWCVSRQRAWGVPLPVLYCCCRQSPIVDRRIIDRLCTLLEERGPDAWWTSSVADLLPTDLAEQLGVKVEEVTKGQDIMDIWLDSGSSWRTLRALEPGAPAALEPRAPAALEPRGPAALEPRAPAALEPRAPAALEPRAPAALEPRAPAALEPRAPAALEPRAPAALEPRGPAAAALCCEGVDQLTGWFQSSLLTSVPLQGRAPYKCIFVHGFVVDAQKRKMSKSLGNVVVPDHIINGDGKKPAYGIDTLRWWVASHGTQHTQIIVSKKLLDDCQAEVIRLRAILKFLLGVLHPPPPFPSPPPLNYFDEYMVAESHKFLKDVNACFKDLRYNNAVQNILHFVSNKVSALYCHCVKDRLYCAPMNSEARIAAQLVAHTILVSLCKAIAPILPHLVEEVWKYHPLYKKPFFFTQSIPILEHQIVDETVMDLVLDIKKDITALTKNENLKKFAVDIKINPKLHGFLSDLNSLDDTKESTLCEILEVSDVCLREQSVSKWEVSVAESRREQCLRCRKYNARENSDKCLRCENATA